MTNDPIADMLVRIKNALMRKRNEVVLPFSRIKFTIAKILEKENFIKKAEKIEEDHGQIKITLKYDEFNEPVIKSLKRISKSGKRVYANKREIPRVLSGDGIVIISTSCGLMTGKEAKKRKLGGEVFCEIY